MFSNAEIKLYLERYEKGYDSNDENYKARLRMYHPKSVKCNDTVVASLNEPVFHTPNYAKSPNTAPCEPGSVVAIAKVSGQIENLFDWSKLPSALPTKREKVSSRILTSSEVLSPLKEKETKKEAVKQRREQQQKKKEEKVLAKLDCAKQKYQANTKQDGKLQKQKEKTTVELNNHDYKKEDMELMKKT